jgi:hypothetical protein
MAFDFDSLTRDKELLKGALQEYGAVFVGDTAFKCPAHEDGHASAGIFCDQVGHWRYKCQGCEFKGDVVDLYKLLGKSFNGQSRGGSKPKIYTKDEITAYLKTLGSVETVYKYPSSKGDIAFYVARVKTSEGKTIRPFTPKNGGFVFGLPAAPRPLYNLPDVKGADTIVVVEGEKCADCLKEYGIIVTTSCGGAKNARYSDWTPLAGKNCILWADNDPDGKRYIQDVASVLSELGARTSFVELSGLDLAEGGDCFDYAEQLKVIGKDREQIERELQKVISSARPKGIADGLGDKFERIIAGTLATVKMPFRWTSFLSNALLPGTLTIICGNVGASKSFMLLQCLAHWYRQDIRCACYELEEDRDFHLQRALAQWAHNSSLTDFDFIRDNPGIARAAIAQQAEFLDGFGRCIEACPETQLTQSQIAEWIRTKARQDNRIIAVDPITAAAQARESWIGDSAFLQSVKRTAVDYDCSIILITHPVKAVSLVDITQLAGSAAYVRFAQTVLWLESHEPKESNIGTDCGTCQEEHNRSLHILKSRNGTGQGKKIAFRFCQNDLTLEERGLIRK